jgi:hypothetical protein
MTDDRNIQPEYVETSGGAEEPISFDRDSEIASSSVDNTEPENTNVSAARSEEATPLTREDLEHLLSWSQTTQARHLH